MRLLTLTSLVTLTSAAILGHARPSLEESPITASAASSSPSASVRNANHIFNAVRGAMRQWDSSWNHNGMCFFLTTVPQGIQFYHGTHKEEAVTGLEWLAFEPEHALMFAMPRPRRRSLMNESDFDARMGSWRKHGRWSSPDELQLPGYNGGERHPPPPFPGQGPEHDGPPPPPHHGPEHPRHPPSPDFTDHEHRSGPPPGLPARDHHGPDTPPGPHPGPPREPRRGHNDPPPSPAPPSFGRGRQQPITFEPSGPPPPPDGSLNGTSYLHFYRTLHPLNLLLIDGMSAGKTGRGTLDSQDYALLASHQVNRTLLAPFNDWYRAEALCNMIQTTWAGKVDGFIRMEGGFEIVLCSFEEHLELIRAQAVPYGDNGLPKGGPKHGFVGESRFRLLKAIADRYHGIGGGRVQVDYANMVSAFSYDLDLFVNNTAIPDELLPRLQNASEPELQRVNSDITSMVLSPAPKSSVDWQAVAEMVVQHFAATLQQLASPELSSTEFIELLTSLLRPSITDGIDDFEVKAHRCVEQFIPSSFHEALAGHAVHEVTRRICSTLIIALDSISSSVNKHVFSVSNPEAHAAAGIRIAQLMSYLSWPSFHFCNPGCAANEICVLPIWPLTSSIEDRKQPSCKNATELAKESGPGGPRGPGRNGDKNYWYDGDEFRGGPNSRRPGEGKPNHEQ